MKCYLLLDLDLAQKASLQVIFIVRGYLILAHSSKRNEVDYNEFYDCLNDMDVG